MGASVSVIIPNYNYGKTLDACLRSVYAQTHPPGEVIVVDDASTDGSVEVARRFPCTVVRSATNRGVSAARNAGAAASSGEVLFFLDSDEALAPDAIANAMAVLRDDPGCGCVHGLIAPEPLVDDGPVEWYKTLHAYWWRRRRVGPVRTAFFAQAAIRRSAYEAAGPFDESLRDSEDLEYSDRLAPLTRIVLSERIVAYHDEVDRLGPLLSEQFRRSQLLARTVLGARRKGRAGLTANRPLGILAVAAALATLPSGIVAGWLTVLPALFLLGFVLADPPLLRFVVRRKGLRFLPFFLGVHLLVHLALLAGAAVGALRMVLDGRPTRWLTPLVVAAALAGVVLALRQDGAAMLTTFLRKDKLPLVAAAVAANLVGLLLGMLAWRTLVPVGGLVAARIFFLGQLGKYLPGRIWGVVTHVDLGRQAGVPGERMAVAYLVSIVLTMLSGAGLGLLAAPRAWIGVLALAVALCLVWPQLLDRPVALLGRALKRPVPPLPPGATRRALAICLASWLVSGAHLWAITVALGAAPGPAAAVAVGAFTLATVVGGLSVLTPDGWGVRELTLTAMVASILPWSAAGAAAVASRLVCVLVEVGTSLVVLAWSRTVLRGGSSVHSVHA